MRDRGRGNGSHIDGGGGGGEGRSGGVARAGVATFVEGAFEVWGVYRQGDGAVSMVVDVTGYVGGSEDGGGESKGEEGEEGKEGGHG